MPDGVNVQMCEFANVQIEDIVMTMPLTAKNKIGLKQ